MKVIGYAWCFENIVIFGNGKDLLGMLNQRKATRYGEFLGVVKGVIPIDNYCITYMWLRNTPAYLKRRYLRRLARKNRMSFRKLKRELKKVPRLTRYL